MKNTYKYRLLSRITLEAVTPLVIGSGNKNIKTDSVVTKDVNDLPYIPATTLAGLIRHSLPEEEQNKWMGYQTKEESYGSQLILSEAKILSEDGKPIDGLNNKEDAITQLCLQLPIRQHVRINHQGVAEKNGKFDEEIVPKGMRFCFEMELMSKEENNEIFVKEPVIQWNDDGKVSIIEKEKVILIPGSSVKGALAHRTAYHYNKLKECFADGKSAEELQRHVGKQNGAVKLLFGSEGDNKGKNKRRGSILISDIIQIQTEELEKKVLNHVKIDRFTGGAVTGALFSEEVLYAHDVFFTLEILLDKAAITEFKENKEDNVDKNKALKAFETALTDLCKGYLPLGGGVNRGNGTFTGSLKKDGDTIYEYK